MAAGPFTFFNAFREKLGNALIDLDTAPFRITLHGSGYTPSVADDDDLADTSHELPTVDGYSAGGAVLTVTWTRSAGTCIFNCDPVNWLASGAGITARFAVVHAALSVSDKPLVGYFLLDSTAADVAITAGNTLTITPHPSGLFTLA